MQWSMKQTHFDIVQLIEKSECMIDSYFLSVQGKNEKKNMVF